MTRKGYVQEKMLPFNLSTTLDEKMFTRSGRDTIP